MTENVSAYFDGTVLRPDRPLMIKPNTRVEITVNIGKDEPAECESQTVETARAKILRIMGERYDTGDPYLSDRHNEHQP